MKQILNSPTTKTTFENIDFFIKRDDLLDKDFTGNKARKFYYFFKNDFKDINHIISYGSNQSNAMYSLSVLAKLKNWKFTYYTNHIPSFLEQNPQGNYKYALENGMQIISGDYDINNIKLTKNQLLINEGGAIEEAQYGIKLLAQELDDFIRSSNLKDVKIFLPSGTGTTALFLQKYLNYEVLTCACVGDEQYLKKQFNQLETNINYHPTILKTTKKFHFGKLYKQNYQIWEKLKEQTDIEFDLLYDPIGWQTLLAHYYHLNCKNIIYIHQGGIIGNETMQQRYQYLHQKANN